MSIVCCLLLSQHVKDAMAVNGQKLVAGNTQSMDTDNRRRDNAR